ncbi:hypothetical protein AB5I41_06280 [Sphingomonas sp. MMS24-JH45]
MTIRIAFLLFPNVTQLDLTGPAQVLSRLGDARLDLVARTREPVPAPTPASRSFRPPPSPTCPPPTSSACRAGSARTT